MTPKSSRSLTFLPFTAESILQVMKCARIPGGGAYPPVDQSKPFLFTPSYFGVGALGYLNATKIIFLRHYTPPFAQAPRRGGGGLIC